ncbi:MAG TPA: histidine phosphatase family protein [Bryobacteraceae bacterium]|jgi:probable phosphoglycerate mutase
MPGELFLIRHGETEWSLSGQHTSRTDLALTEKGRLGAKALGEILKDAHPTGGFSLVLSSPMRRALETCHLAGYQPEIENNLHEWDYGAYEGLTSGDIQKTAPGWTIWTGPVPGGESPAQVGARADRVIQRSLAAAGDVALFSHGHMLRVLAARWLELAPDDGRLLGLDTASVSALGWEHTTRVIRLWNRTA